MKVSADAYSLLDSKLFEIEKYGNFGDFTKKTRAIVVWKLKILSLK
ncbi:hypothetical protein [Treponema phagedenis]|nr:hypothetical protein [Treponema phagedenis]NVP25437.1 hypothetical protein [Treponema phagedenis]QLC57559.1 hypothetical protein HW453_01045 [Treponema phagedenis]